MGAGFIPAAGVGLDGDRRRGRLDCLGDAGSDQIYGEPRIPLRHALPEERLDGFRPHIRIGQVSYPVQHDGPGFKMPNGIVPGVVDPIGEQQMPEFLTTRHPTVPNHLRNVFQRNQQLVTEISGKIGADLRHLGPPLKGETAIRLSALFGGRYGDSLSGNTLLVCCPDKFRIGRRGMH